MSGLQLNTAKSDLFVAEISPRNLHNIIISTGFKNGLLLVRYLGVPLVTRKLTTKDCTPLIDKIKLRIHQWSGKHLNYVGRLELVKAVLQSIANFWCRQFLLPQAVINKINQLCSRFLWKGTDSVATGARLIRNLLAGEGSLWIAWIYNYVIKSKEFLQMPTSVTYINCFNRLLKLKVEAIPILNARVTKTKDIWDEI
ncbi:uncharacterized protein LOC120161446 [Hibiscus syriacus]|uniref:uncharacterized protein LOC120161446 n=1 Tax=Hibiscus syriacus TaxID=106335 RepID=UPI0019233ABB|nr:uncharacterized protein LOC120161446 [Hibiscus syriacus]